MPAQTTAPTGERPGLSMRGLRVRVEAGPDAGACVDAGTERLTVGSADGNDLVLTDPEVSRFHLELAADGAGARVVDCGSTNGTRYAGARVERAWVPDGASLEIGGSRLRVSDGGRVEVPLAVDDDFGGLVGRTPTMRRLFARAALAAESDASVLVVGESGSGKEGLCRALHARSPRAEGPFVIVDCGALAPTLVASELFGHERGAFTGADRRHEGALERASGGTLFLDEVGELPRSLQPMLLGALERRGFRRLGGRDELTFDARVVAATHRDLRGAVNSGDFRLDLYYRLAVITLVVPPLRERPDDLVPIVRHFFDEHGVAPDDPRVEALVDAARGHAWPGNVRELRNAVESALILGEAPALGGPGSIDLDDGVRPVVAPALLELPYAVAKARWVDDFERAYVARALERSRGNVASAARHCGMDRTYLIRLVQKHGLRGHRR